MARIRWYVSVSSVIAVVVAGLSAQSTALPKPGPEHKKLEAFLGPWTYEGEAKQSPFGPAGKVSGTDVYESGPGGFSLQHHWDEKNPIGGVKGMEMWAYDPSKKTYVCNGVSSAGEMWSCTLNVTGSVWSWLQSGITFEGKTAWSRGTYTFAGPNVFTIKVDASTDGKTWAPAFEGKWTKK
jgi:hypothetical protein